MCTHTLYLFKIVDNVVVRFQKQLYHLTKGLDSHHDNLAFLIVQELDQLWVEVLEALLRRQILADEGQLAADFLSDLPVEVLADVRHNGQDVLLERLDTEQRVSVCDRA